MTRKTYRTAQGRHIDLGALQLRNENIRAVGNMNVNARGDLIDSWNQPIESRNQAVKKTYDNQVSRVRDESVFQKTSAPAPVRTNKPAENLATELPLPPEDFDDEFEKSQETSEDNAGLAAAIARARQIRQETIQTPKDAARNRSGVKRI